MLQAHAHATSQERGLNSSSRCTCSGRGCAGTGHSCAAATPEPSPALASHATLAVICRLRLIWAGRRDALTWAQRGGAWARGCRSGSAPARATWSHPRRGRPVERSGRGSSAPASSGLGSGNAPSPRACCRRAARSRAGHCSRTGRRRRHHRGSRGRQGRPCGSTASTRNACQQAVTAQSDRHACYAPQCAFAAEGSGYH